MVFSHLLHPNYCLLPLILFRCLLSSITSLGIVLDVPSSLFCSFCSPGSAFSSRLSFLSSILTTPSLCYEDSAIHSPIVLDCSRFRFGVRSKLVSQKIC